MLRRAALSDKEPQALSIPVASNIIILDDCSSIYQRLIDHRVI